MKAKNQSIVDLANAAIVADKQYALLCDADANDEALDQAGTRHRAAMTALAALASGSVRDLQAKGETLATAFLARRDGHASVEDDYGLTASVVQDLRYLEALNPRPTWPRGMSERMAAEYVGLSISSVRSARGRRDFPDPVTLTPGRVVYLREMLDAWLDRKAGRAPAPDLTGGEWMAAVRSGFS